MRRALLVMWLCALVCPVVARAADQYARYNGSCAQGGMKVITNGTESQNFVVRSFPRCTVTVYLHGTLNKATLFSDAAGTLPLLNPFQAAQTGAASWYAPDARYDAQYSGGQGPNNSIATPFTISDIQLCFACSGGGSGGSSNATQLQGINIATTAPLLGQFLGFNGTQWTPTTITGFLALTGGTLTGPLTLFGNPIAVNDAANKGYVDTRLLSKADLLLGVVPTNELGSGAADITKCLAGNSTWQPCGGSATFPFAAPDASAPQYSFGAHLNVGLNTILGVPMQIISVQVAGSAGNQTITATLATPLRPLGWGQNDTFRFANLPASPTDLTSLNGTTFTVPLNGVTGNTPTSTVTFVAGTSIGASTYTVATGTAAIWDGYLQGYSYAFNRLDSSTLTGGLNIISEHGSIRLARRDAICSRAGGVGLTGIDNCLIRGSQSFDPVNSVGAGTMSVNGAHSLGATSLSITKGAGVNWLAKAGDVIEIGKVNGDAEKQDYIVASDTTVVQGTSTSVPITSVLPGTGLATALTGGELIVASRIQAQVGDAAGIEVLGPATFATDINVYGNINQLGTGAWLTSGTKQSAVTVTVPQGKDFSIFVGSDNLFHCQLSSLLGGGSCGGSGGGGGVASVGLAAPAAFSVSGSPVTGSGTLTLGYGSGQIPIANLATGTPTGLKFIRDDGTLVAPLTFSSTPVSVITVGSPITSSLVGNTLSIGCTTCLPFSGALTNGDLLSANGSSQAVDAGVVAANVVTSVSNFTSGNIPKAAGANKALTNGYGVQGTDTNLITSGTISGVGASLCTDAQGGATTVGCASGTSVVQISGTPSVNQTAVWTNATTIQGLTATGTLGSPVYSVSPTLVTPVLGVATATTINKVTITAPASAATLTIANGKTFTASNTITLTGTDGVSLNVSNVPTAAAVYTSGNLISAAASDRTTVDSGVVAANVVTSASNFVNAHVPIAGGANKTLVDGFATQGTDTSLLTSGTISGTLGATLCLDAQSGATTTGCTGSGSGNTTSTTLTTNTLPKANGANSIVDSLWTDNGTVAAYAGTGGIQTGSTGTGQWLALEGAAPSGLSANDLMYASDATGPCSGGHGWAIKNNNGAADCLASANNVLTWNNKLFDTALTGNVLRINGLSITGTSGNTPSLATVSGAFTSGNLTMTDASHNVVDASIVAANVPTTTANFTTGNLVQGAGANKTLSDSGVVAANVVTAAAVFVSGHIPKAAGATRIITDGYGVQGTDTNLITSGTIAGTSVLVCTDANGGITTTACPAPTASAGGSNTQLQYNNATALGGITQWTTNGTTTVTSGATGVLDLSAASVTGGFKIPVAAGAVPTVDGFQATNTTTHAHVWGSNGATIVGAAAATGTNTNTVCATSNWVSTISGVAAPTCTQPSVSDLSTGAIVNGATATTQATFSNDTKVATDAYVDAAVKPVFSTAVTGTSMVTAGTNTVLVGPITMVTPGAAGTYRLVVQITQTTTGSGGTCTVGTVGVSIGYKDFDTSVSYAVGTTSTIAVMNLSGTTLVSSATMASAANGAINNYTSNSREFRAAASTAIQYQVFQVTNSNCTTPPVFAVRPALYYMGY